MSSSIAYCANAARFFYNKAHQHEFASYMTLESNDAGFYAELIIHVE